MANKRKVLLIGSGGVGTIAALNLELGGQASVTALLRSNFRAVKDKGFTIRSTDHGQLEGWRPTESEELKLSLLEHRANEFVVIDQIPHKDDAHFEPFDYIILTTKNIPDIGPRAVEIIKKSVVPQQTVIVLIQNGLNIERPFFNEFPKNIVLSGVSIIGSREVSHGVIEHDGHDSLTIGPFPNTNLDPLAQEMSAKDFISIYTAAGKCTCTYEKDVLWARWRKLVYNACLNPICAITGLDTGRVQLAEDLVETLVKPAMREIVAAAAATGHVLPDDIAQTMVTLDPLQMYYAPSMLEDLRKVRKHIITKQ